MTRIRDIVSTVTACLVAALLAVSSAAAQGKSHRLVLQVNTDELAVMTLAYYRELGEKVEIEIVAFGPGLHMLRDDSSPVKGRIKAMVDKSPSISFKACGNTQENMSKAENKKIPLVPQASVVKSGVVRVMELQEQGWSYVRP